jgi:hypothetical protein
MLFFLLACYELRTTANRRSFVRNSAGSR